MQSCKFTCLYLILRGKDRNQLYLKRSCLPFCFPNTSDLQASWSRGHILTTIFPKEPTLYKCTKPFSHLSGLAGHRKEAEDTGGEGECIKGLFNSKAQLNLAGAAGALLWCENWELHKVSLAFSPCQLDFTAGVYLLHMCGVWQPEGSYQRLWIKGYAAINTKPAGFRAPCWAAFRPEGSRQEKNRKGIGCGC